MSRKSRLSQEILESQAFFNKRFANPFIITPETPEDKITAIEQISSVAGIVTSLFVSVPETDSYAFEYFAESVTGVEHLLSKGELFRKFSSQNSNPQTLHKIKELDRQGPKKIFFDSDLTSERTAWFLRYMKHPVVVNAVSNSALFWDVQASGYIPIQNTVMAGSGEKDVYGKLFIKPTDAEGQINTITAEGKSKFELAIVQLDSLDADRLKVFIQNGDEVELKRSVADSKHTELVAFCIDRSAINCSGWNTGHGFPLDNNVLIITQASEKEDGSTLAIDSLRKAGFAVIEADSHLKKSQSHGKASHKDFDIVR